MKARSFDWLICVWFKSSSDWSGWRSRACITLWKPLDHLCCCVLEQTAVAVSSESADPELTPCSDLPLSQEQPAKAASIAFFSPLRFIDHPKEEFSARSLLSIWEVSMQGQLWNSASGKLKGFHWLVQERSACRRRQNQTCAPSKPIFVWE